MARTSRAWIATILAFALAQYASASAEAADWQEGAGPEWQKVLSAAKQEGTVAVSGPPQLATAISEGFLRDTGIPLQYLAGEARTTSSRLARELRANNVTVDATLTGMVDLPLVKNGFFEDVRARLLLPGVTDPKNWADGQLKFNDNAKRFMLQTHAYRSSVPFYNANLIKPTEFTSWQKLLDPKLKGKIVAYDPRSGGPGQAMSTYIGAQFGLDFLKRVYVGQEVVYSLDSRQMAEWVVRGIHAVGLGILTPDYLKFRDAGMNNIVPTDLADGPGTLTGGFSVILLPKGPPHPNAATVFLNWYASQPGQEAFSRAFKVPSRRTDVNVEGVPDYTIPKPGRKYHDQYNEDWAATGRPIIQKQVMEIVGGK
jgi:ABC-type Fe3+ transport system substrate-binding protein